MKIISTFAFILVFSLFISCKSQDTSFKDISLNNKIDSVSYYMGLNIAQSVKSQGLDQINAAAIAKAFTDVYSGKKTADDTKQTEAFLNDYFRGLHLAKAEKEKQAGIDFLEKNKTKAGVITLPSGLQYQVITEGHGPKPLATDKVTVHYAGTTIEGKEFDSSIKRGQPVTFQVNGVIVGWQEALQLMPVGSKWKLFVPSELAYGERGAGDAIGPNSALIFDIELLSIAK
jgi:FKBP-type peptidyl-prolyl cis-trans isomerase FklB